MKDSATPAQPLIGLPPWVVLHVPHDSTLIPESVRAQFLLSDPELQAELIRMTDHRTLDLFAQTPGTAAVVRAPVSRLVIDVERFPDDTQEPMAARGMGAVYVATSDLTPLRRPLSASERTKLMEDWYWPHHQRLEAVVSDVLAKFDHCLVLDCHSFPSRALPYELVEHAMARLDICIGTDEFHTPAPLASAFASAFTAAGWTVTLNDPFSGALVPSSRFGTDRRVSAIMVEVNRSLYIDEKSAEPNSQFELVTRQIRKCCLAALREVWPGLLPASQTPKPNVVGAEIHRAGFTSRERSP